MRFGIGRMLDPSLDLFLHRFGDDGRGFAYLAGLQRNRVILGERLHAALDGDLATAPAFGLARPAARFGLLLPVEAAIEAMPLEPDQRFLPAVDQGEGFASAFNFSDGEQGSWLDPRISRDSFDLAKRGFVEHGSLLIVKGGAVMLEGTMSRLSRLIRERKQHVFSMRLRASRYFGETAAALISDNTAQLNYLFNVFPEEKLIYVEVPKAGCTTIKTFLSRHMWGRDPVDCHDRQQSGLLSPIDIGFDRFDALLRDPDLLLFTVVRNPFARLRSCYLDKFANVNLAEPQHDGMARQIFAGSPTENRLSFNRFVEQACATAATTNNGHWMPMARMVPMIMPITVIKLENLVDEMSPVLHRLSRSGDALRRRHNSTKPDPSIQWTEPLASRVRHSYADDFRLFGYSTRQGALAPTE